MQVSQTAAQELPRPKSIEEVDAWLANYLALVDAARADAVRVDRLNDAAPKLVAALIQAIEEDGFEVSGPTDPRAAEHGEPAWVCNARAVLAEAGI